MSGISYLASWLYSGRGAPLPALAPHNDVLHALCASSCLRGNIKPTFVFFLLPWLSTHHSRSHFCAPCENLVRFVVNKSPFGVPVSYKKNANRQLQHIYINVLLHFHISHLKSDVWYLPLRFTSRPRLTFSFCLFHGSSPLSSRPLRDLFRLQRTAASNT